MTPRQARLGVDVFTGVVVATVGLALGSLTWRLLGHPGIGPAAAPVAAGGEQSADVRPIIALSPFGSAMAAPAASGDGAIQLRAIFLAAPMEASVALIAGADGKVESYAIGQAVGGGVIEAIEAEQIVLRTPSGQRAVGFDPESASAVSGAPSGPVPASGSAAVPVAAPPPAPATGVDAIRALIPSGAQGRAAPPAASQPPPGAANNTPATSGFRVGSSPPAPLLAAGIRPGDVIERINGSAVGGGIGERELIARAMAAGTARVEVLRGGQRVSLTVTTR